MSDRTQPGMLRWRGSIVNPGLPVGTGQGNLWTTMMGDQENAAHKVQGFCCLNPDHGDDPCAANDHGGWLDFAEMLRYAADAMQPGCQLAFIVEPLPPVEKPEVGA